MNGRSTRRTATVFVLRKVNQFGGTKSEELSARYCEVFYVGISIAHVEKMSDSSNVESVLEATEDSTSRPRVGGLETTRRTMIYDTPYIRTVGPNLCDLFLYSSYGSHALCIHCTYNLLMLLSTSLTTL